MQNYYTDFRPRLEIASRVNITYLYNLNSVCFHTIHLNQKKLLKLQKKYTEITNKKHFPKEMVSSHVNVRFKCYLSCLRMVIYPYSACKHISVGKHSQLSSLHFYFVGKNQNSTEKKIGKKN